MPATPPGFLILDDTLEAARAGQPLILDGDEGRHAAKVARIGVGEQVLLTDSPGRQARAEVTAARKEALDLRLLADPSPALQRLPRLALVQALATGGRDEQAVEAATELGADRIVPWIARRSVSVWRGDKLVKGRAKWAATVRTAVKQCRRRGIPAVDQPLTSAQLLAELRRRTADGAMVLILHEQESTGLISLSGTLRAASEQGLEEIIVVVGPEGGIAPEELEGLRELGARPVLLGPEVLRTSTAGPAAIAVLSALLGRWG